jgi:hypothetical protein
MTRIIFFLDGTWTDNKGDKCTPLHNDLVDVDLCDRGWDQDLAKYNLKTVGVDDEFFRVVKD